MRAEWGEARGEEGDGSRPSLPTLKILHVLICLTLGIERKPGKEESLGIAEGSRRGSGKSSGGFPVVLRHFQAAWG